jgi:phosphate uptake regulator/aminoglycoside phosphotransferase
MNNLPSNIIDNLHFLIVEVSNQIDELKRFFKSPTIARAQRVLDRRGYSENLMSRIQNACIQGIAEAEERRIPRLRAIQNIAADLDRITDLARDAIKQMSRMESGAAITGKSHLAMLDNVSVGIDLIEETLEQNDTRLALKYGELERNSDREYRKLLKDYTQALKRGKQTADLVSALLVAHTLERMGDLLLDLGEALLSSILGQSMDLDRYRAMMDSLQRLSDAGKQEDMIVETIAETRSGSGISGITSKSRRKKKASSYVAIYKDGLRRKLKEERDGVENWHEIYPGLAPRILSYKKRGDTASLLIEHLAGMTFEQILVNESDELLAQTLRKLAKTLNKVWKETKTGKSVPADFMGQLNKRINDVYAVHPEFESSSSRLCGYKMASFAQLVKQAEKIEQKLKPPFSVYIHGDFNVDNIIYDRRERKISYIDLHRSRYMDYVQDVSVFMVSNYRLQIMAAPVRRRIVGVIENFYRIANRYSRRNQDDTFELRLALGLARSFATSTRFILDKSLARNMYLRARYLLEQVIRLEERDYADYKVPVKELFVG